MSPQVSQRWGGQKNFFARSARELVPPPLKSLRRPWRLVCILSINTTRLLRLPNPQSFSVLHCQPVGGGLRFSPQNTLIFNLIGSELKSLGYTSNRLPVKSLLLKVEKMSFDENGLNYRYWK